MPKGAYILPGSAVPKILRQCSRSAPKIGEGSWQPQAAGIRELEAALPGELRKRSSGESSHWQNLLRDWRRQYVGIVRGGRRYIYGSFAQDDSSSIAFDWQREPMQVCDGGVSFFGVEYDVARRRFTHVAFNGPY
ncbi:hypothetical protein [Sphingomonas alpina]|uniref:Uncharacterized protein n=1 Tax=Sphingomonas alpina TaxID=653931 RepID=A0A7H0LJX6_9SPHN|nr:hypothetical protein [Sphingomonas alpina]QNQ09979.1 hypothetical protein H3Z74_01620 [Sphingomonas alpina]